jgi:hypothetical protein
MGLVSAVKRFVKSRLARRRAEPEVLALVGGAALLAPGALAVASDIHPLGPALLVGAGSCFVGAGLAIVNHSRDAVEPQVPEHPPAETRRTGLGLALFGGLMVLGAVARL